MPPSSLLEALVARVPQQRPFRFVDRLLALSETHVAGEYTFRLDEGFYAGHFPGDPVTPGVILIEAIAQIAVVPLGLHLLSLEAPSGVAMAPLLTNVQVDFRSVVRPGETVRVEAERIFWRMRKLKVAATVSRVLPSGELELVAQGTVSGMVVARPPPG